MVRQRRLGRDGLISSAVGSDEDCRGSWNLAVCLRALRRTGVNYFSMWLTESSLFLVGNGNAGVKPNLQLSLRGAVREVSDGGPLRGRSGGGGRRGQALESPQTSTSCHLVVHAASQHPLSAALLAPLPGYSAPWASLPTWTVNCMSQSVMSVHCLLLYSPAHSQRHPSAASMPPFPAPSSSFSLSSSRTARPVSTFPFCL